jgi:ribosome-associated protein
VFVRASGPGGQNVNKVASAVQLRFDARRSRGLPDAVALRLMALAGQATDQGRRSGVDRRPVPHAGDEPAGCARPADRDLIREAAAPPPPKRRATKPTKASVERRISAKKGRSDIKKGRTGKFED